ncbi:hypothetical protein [Terrabacter sp. Soil810]|nr:hypothetical protein [Terrabacter sp. Soil810]
MRLAIAMAQRADDLSIRPGNAQVVMRAARRTADVVQDDHGAVRVRATTA